ncbi:hypothetical protein SAMN04488077_10714 [Roseovarius tolerans]|uniref:Uncharacterized protein n=1 Tax=Roseovarius tolerans TaxID=74031 RepID=A0A1H8ADS9_9RHOB|nr:hypothetical protein [Roseovarius tolerans]SEM68880.1 hypothetical protein SAMN04488077_10714 [Roseovarius tolerans]
MAGTEQGGEADRLAATLEGPLTHLQEARPFAKPRFQAQVLDVAGRLLTVPDGIARLHALAPRMDAAGIFAGSDWDAPANLLPGLVSGTLEHGAPASVAAEAVSLLRLLAVAKGETEHPRIHAAAARRFLTQVLALNMRRFFGATDEAARMAGAQQATTDALFRYLAEHVGFQDVLGELVDEIWRILRQRPIQVAHAKDMIAQIAITLSERGGEIGDRRLGADRLVSALFGPTSACMGDPGLDTYHERLAVMDETDLRHEAQGLARAMHDTGLVSDYHAAFLTWVLETEHDGMVADTLGLGTTGRDCMQQHRGLILELIRRAVRPETAQALYGMSLMLDRGILHHAPIAPALRRQLELAPCPAVAERLSMAGLHAADPADLLLAGCIQVLGLPLGVGQGANPTCQSARAIAMWAQNDPDYLLHLVAQGTRIDSVMMHFEGRAINSADLPAGLALGAPLDADPVSVVLVPHLDRIYAEMGRLCAARNDDPHIWINPEFHGWWVGRACAVAVDVPTGALAGIEDFIARFHTAYHPQYNSGEPVIHPQPAGIAATDAAGRFVGWHAITILRVVPDREGEMRVYFYNPNNDSGQDWGAGAVVSTHGSGERFGEASLPFETFASRLYLFHEDGMRPAASNRPAQDILERVAGQARGTWAAGREEISGEAISRLAATGPS